MEQCAKYKIVLYPKPGTNAMERDNWGEFETLYDTVKYISEELLPWGYGDAYSIRIVDNYTGELMLFDEIVTIIGGNANV